AFCYQRITARVRRGYDVGVACNNLLRMRTRHLAAKERQVRTDGLDWIRHTDLLPFGYELRVESGIRLIGREQGGTVCRRPADHAFIVAPGARTDVMKRTPAKRRLTFGVQFWPFHCTPR